VGRFGKDSRPYGGSFQGWHALICGSGGSSKDAGVTRRVGKVERVISLDPVSRPPGSRPLAYNLSCCSLPTTASDIMFTNK
jgi:hypothetical protein